MEYTKLGRTGLRVSVAGLGCGGSSRLGQATGKSVAESVAIVRRALDLGVTFFDTAEVYGTEEILGEALRDVPRDSVVVSTKSRIRTGETVKPADSVIENLDASLRKLRMDHVDVFHVHAVKPGDYAHARDVIAPALLREKEKGKFKHLGITESPPNDARQAMLQRALPDDLWDVVMLGFHMMHQGPRRTVFPLTQRQGIGTLIMFAVRRIFSDRAYLVETLAALARAGKVPAHLADAKAPLDFLIHDGGAASVIDAAYRYARHEPGADVILFGTGDPGHLETNLASILKPPLPETDRRMIADLFGALEGVGLDLPWRRTGG